jgi:hypothetical protein
MKVFLHLSGRLHFVGGLVLSRLVLEGALLLVTFRQLSLLLAA